MCCLSRNFRISADRGASNRTWQEGVTDRDDDLEILSGVACYSLQPFEEVYHTTRSFAGSIEYGFV
jgi:hypothetical protein